MGSEYGGAVLTASDVVPDDSSYILGYNSNLNYNDNSSFMENQPVGTIVGEFNATDPDANATLTYHLVSGAGDDNNSLFTLDTNGTLKTAAILDYEAGSNLSIRVQVSDEYNATVEGNFTVTLSDANDPASWNRHHQRNPCGRTDPDRIQHSCRCRWLGCHHLPMVPRRTTDPLRRNPQRRSGWSGRVVLPLA